MSSRHTFRRLFPLLAAFLLLAGAAVAAGGEARLLRFPNIQGDKVVFVYGGDLWTVSARGGEAHRITSLEAGYDVLPKISPDGRWIAFSGEYAGNRQVYVIPYEGGMPHQVTRYPDVGSMPPRGGYDHLVFDWTPDGKKILVKSNRTGYGQRIGKYFLVDPSGPGVEEPLQIPEGAPATFSPDGHKLAYSIISREFRTWKRYRAGRAQDVWIYDLDKNTIKQVTHFEGTDNFPMWVGDRIYFTSDRDKTLNIYCYDLKTEKIRQVTHFTDYDCLFPSRGQGGIIFENGGYLWVLDTPSEKLHQLHITLADDRPATRPVFKDVSRNIDSFAISPSGARALFTARGDIFSVPAEHGPVRNLSLTPAKREMDVHWSPDGRWISYLAETNGYYEIFIRPQDNSAPARQLTSGSRSWILGHEWSPDSTKIAFTNLKNELKVVDVAGGTVSLADTSTRNRFQDVAWSADSNWLVYTKQADNSISRAWAYSLTDNKAQPLTGDVFSAASPVFDPEGQYLYFISRRDFNYRQKNFEAKIFVATLRPDEVSPLAPRSDEETVSADTPDTAKAEKPEHPHASATKTAESGPMVVVAEGLPGRVLALPVDTGRYRSLTAIKGGLLFLDGARLQRYTLKSRKVDTIANGVMNYALAAGGKKILVQQGPKFAIIPLKPGNKTGTGTLDLSRMEMRIDPLVEWKQIYSDAWRIMRDWFYDPGMHGVDWQKIHDKYAVMLPYLATRKDLDFLLGEMIGELNCGHTYVFPGDEEEIKRVDIGLLGCEFAADGDTYKISKIYAGEDWDKRSRSPLTEPGLNVTPGTYLLAIDGQKLTTAISPYSLLENKADTQVRLTVNTTPSVEGARDIVVVPIKSELRLRYLDWVAHNRAIVDKLSGGRIGYIHVPDTSFDGFEQMHKWFAPLSNKEALIIDDRYNGGGNIPDSMVEMMARTPLNYWARRNLDLYSQPYVVNTGPKVMLINGYSSSGGDAFPTYFRKMKVGPLMGKKTWGGLVGYSWSPRFVDGGGMAVPAFAFVNTKGEWDVEAVGVAPDPGFEVFDDPTLIAQGREPMLEHAVKYLLEQLEKNPPSTVKRPAPPKRN